MKKTVVGVALAGLLVTGAAQAEFKFDPANLYAGGGLAYTMYDWDQLENSIGYNLFVGYDLGIKLADSFSTAVEVGFASSGDPDVKDCNTCEADAADGLWLNGVFGYDINSQVNAIGRIGLDLGDDDGLMLGIGAGYKVSDVITVRAEYVIRDNTDMLQANVVYDF